MSEFKYKMDEIFRGAIMGGIPIILVEGRDDIKFYKNLCLSLGKEVDVIGVDNVQGFADGCVGVIECISSLQEELKKNVNNLKYILGIIDKDARYYRNEIPNEILGLFVLNYYSYESHFITKQNLKHVIANTTYVSPATIDDKTLAYIEHDVISDLEELFYVSLEALKKACIKGYDSVVSYDLEAGYIFNNLHNGHNIMDSINLKKDNLDDFAKQYNITFNDFKNVIKGKWLLHGYYSSIYKRLKNLSQVCKENLIHQCQYCKTGQTNKCLWKFSANYTLGIVISTALNYYDEYEVGYIKDRLKQLA